MNSPSNSVGGWPLKHVSKPRSASIACLAIVVFMYGAIGCYGDLFVRQTPEKWYPPAAWLPRASDGLLNFTFACTVSTDILIVGVFLLGICRFRPRDLGLVPSKIPAAILLTALIWAVTQVIVVIVLVLMSREIALNPAWTNGKPSWAAGHWIAQLFGVTPPEEIVFRGFLFPQFLLLMLCWLPNSRTTIQIATALILSQILFALIHVSGNLYRPQGQWLLLIQFVMGLVFAGVYLRTGNLFLAMGVHVLSNSPSPLLKEAFDGPGLSGGIVMLGTLAAVTIGPWAIQLGRRWRHKDNSRSTLGGGRDPGS